MNIVNPFYSPFASEPMPQMAKLPRAPINGSPVPGLTSLVNQLSNSLACASY